MVWQQIRRRLKIDFAIGYSLVLLRGDAWLLRFPLVFGRVTVVCERDLSKQFDNMVVNRAGKPHQKALVNLLKLIEKLPQGLANQLTEDELRELLSYYMFGHRFYNAVASFCKDKEIVAAAIADLHASAHAGIGDAHNYGQSLWLSLQAAGKMLKYFIQAKGEQFPHIHDLARLTKLAYTLGLQPIDTQLIDEVQCDANVRYTQQQYPVMKVGVRLILPIKLHVK
jgi:HEPN domain-containing protein